MFTNTLNCEVNDEVTLGLTQFCQDDKFFRSDFVKEQFDALPRARFKDIGTIESYNNFVYNLAPVLFIDIGDIHHYVALNKICGLDTTDIEILANIVFDYFNEQDNLDGIIWEMFSENIPDVLMAKLGLDYNDTLLSTTFDICMKNLYNISYILHSYLINARTPIVETNCIYQFGRYKNGIIGARLRTFDELKDIYAD